VLHYKYAKISAHSAYNMMKGDKEWQKQKINIKCAVRSNNKAKYITKNKNGSK
jgi:hypothetical protein